MELEDQGTQVWGSDIAVGYEEEMKVEDGEFIQTVFTLVINLLCTLTEGHKEDEAALVAGLNVSDVGWEEGHICYGGSLPWERVPNTADQHIEMWDNQSQKYCMLTTGYTILHNPQDDVDAVNWNNPSTEKHCCTAINCAGCKICSHNTCEEQEKLKN